MQGSSSKDIGLVILTLAFASLVAANARGNWTGVFRADEFGHSRQRRPLVGKLHVALALLVGVAAVARIRRGNVNVIVYVFLTSLYGQH